MPVDELAVLDPGARATPCTAQKGPDCGLAESVRGRHAVQREAVAILPVASEIPGRHPAIDQAMGHHGPVAFLPKFHAIGASKHRYVVKTDVSGGLDLQGPGAIAEREILEIHRRTA